MAIIDEIVAYTTVLKMMGPISGSVTTLEVAPIDSTPVSSEVKPARKREPIVGNTNSNKAARTKRKPIVSLFSLRNSTLWFI